MIEQPTAKDIRAVREQAGITTTAAAEMIHKDVRSWQRYESGQNEMDLAVWELFLLKLANGVSS